MSEAQRTALITGANRGIGFATAHELHRRGIHVVLAARNEHEAIAAAERLGERATPIGLDVTDPHAVQRVSKEVGHIDILVSNAGVLLDADDDPLSIPITAVEETFRVNLFGSWLVAQAIIPSMIRRGWGRVVMMSSATGAFSVGLYPPTAAYSASKTALNGLTTMLASVTEGTGVLVNAVNPGRTKTRMVPSASRPPDAAAIEIADAATLTDDGPTGAFLRGEHRFDW